MKISEIKRLIVSARNSQIKANAKMAVVLHNLENDIGIDLENIPNNSAENANNLAEAIMCHILYGECDLNELLDDIEKALADHPTERGGDNDA